MKRSRRLGRTDEACAAYARALELAKAEPERRLALVGAAIAAAFVESKPKEAPSAEPVEVAAALEEAA
jgi:hypothetical protein